MTKLIFSILIMLFCNFYTLAQIKVKFAHLMPIDISLVEHGEISKMYRRPIKVIDSTSITSEVRQMTSAQLQAFADMWNTAIYKGMCKFKSKYVIVLYFKDVSKRVFFMNNNIIENLRYFYKPIHNQKFKVLWKNAVAN